MKHRTVLLALVALVAVGCGTTSDTESTAQVETPKAPETVAQAGSAEATPVEGAQASAEPSAEAPAADATKKPQAKPPTAPAARAAAARPPQGDAGGVRAEQRDSARAGGQEGRPPGGRGFNVGAMLRSEQIKTELKITEDQAKKLEAALPQQGQGGGGQEMTQEERAKRRTETEAKVKAILNPAQQQRLQQIELQMRGPRALTRDAVAKDLGLTADQTKKIEAALDVPRPQGGQGGPDAGGGGFDREAIMKARAEANKKALAILTATQKTQWEKMLGKPFVFQTPQTAGGGGGNRGG